MRRLTLGVLFLATALFGQQDQYERGRHFYMLGEYKKAITSLEEALTLAPNDANLYLWLGRAQGRKAEHANPLTAPSWATKARTSFEKSVELNPKNVEALSDLFEYYLEAPGFLGGGFDKAVAMAKKIEELDRSEGHYARFRLAEKKGDLAAAEKALRCAQPAHVVDLARFLAKQGRFQESDALFLKAEQKPGVLFDRAETYIRHNRNIEQARELLKRYLAADLTPDDPPRQEAEKLLKKAL